MPHGRRLHTLWQPSSAHAIVFRTLLTIGGKENRSGARRESVPPILRVAARVRWDQRVPARRRTCARKLDCLGEILFFWTHRSASQPDAGSCLDPYASSGGAMYSRTARAPRYPECRFAVRYLRQEPYAWWAHVRIWHV